MPHALQFASRRCLALGLFAAATASPVLADDNFSVTVDVGPTSGSVAADTLEEFIDLGFESEGLNEVNSAYSDVTPANVNLDFRGLDLSVEYPDTGSGLVFSVPELDVTKIFDEGLTREDNEEALLDYLEADEDDTLSRILEWLVSETPTDPVAGNPASLQGQMISQSFSLGTGLGAGPSFETPSDPAAGEDGEGRNNIFGLGARLGRFQVDGDEVTTIELPFQFVQPLSDPRYAVVLDFPVTYSDINGAESFAAAFGAGVRVPITTNWSLTPSLRAGVTGSIDLGTIATMYSANVASQYSFDWAASAVTIGNMLSYIATAGVGEAIDDFEINYDLQNTVTRNGIGVEGPLDWELFGLPTTWEASAVNTMILGDDVYVDNYTDFAISVGSKQSRNGLTWDSVRIGLTYTVGSNDFQSLNVNFGYQF